MRAKIFIGSLLLLVLVNGFVWYAAIHENRHGILKVSVLDIGQGDAIFIESPTGNQVLIDGGRSREVIRRLGEQMPFYDQSLDLVMETHPDADHIGGLSPVIDRYHVENFMEPGMKSDTQKIDDALESDVYAHKINRIIARRGMVVDLGGGAKLNVLFPDRDMTGADTNDASIVAKLVYGDTSFLFTGDSPQEIEDYLISLDGSKLQSTVLKVGHHGSKFSTSHEYAEAVHPQFAAISVGIKNTYGHPSPEALDHLNAVGAMIDMTENEGTIHYESDGERVVKK